MMDDPRYLRGQTVLSAFKGGGYSVAAITAKNKLLRLLGKGLDGACCFIEYAGNLLLQGHTLSEAMRTIVPTPSAAPGSGADCG